MLSQPSEGRTITQTHTTQTAFNNAHHLNAFDGVRGLLAVWVYLGHVANAVGFHQYLLAAHALAVDFFMILSGFLMIHTWKADLYHHPVNLKTTLRFYLARLFRIAPLYYLLLLVCYLALPALSLMQASALRQYHRLGLQQSQITHLQSAGTSTACNGCFCISVLGLA